MFLYRVPDERDQQGRDEPYHRMAAEGLLPYAMPSFVDPTLEDWRFVSDPAKSWMLRCTDAMSADLLGVALFTPWRNRVWEFDFTAFRSYFPKAVDMARGGFAWMFDHAPCDSIIGMCPAPNRQARSLAKACGFQLLGSIPGACMWARTKTFVPAVMFVVTAESLANTNTRS